jgi:Ca2+-binding EF-hand superfamily protein
MKNNKMADINEYKKVFKIYYEKANGFVKEQKVEETMNIR